MFQWQKNYVVYCFSCLFATEYKMLSCLVLFSLRNICIGIPYEDDDYREGDYEDDQRPNDIRDVRPLDQQGGRFNQLHDMTRQTHFDVGGGRDPPVPEYGGYRGYPYHRPPYAPQPYAPQAQPQPQPQQPQPQPQPQPHAAQQPQQPAGAQQYDGGRGAFGYNPYGQYTYNPYYRPGYYGWNRPTPAADPWRGFGLGFPFNLLGLGGTGSNYRPWWSGSRWGLPFF